MSLRSTFLITALSIGLVSPVLAQAPAPSTPAPSPSSPSMPSPATAPAPVSDLFYTDAWVPTHWRASEAIGQGVFNRSGERIGEIDELLIDGSGRVMAAVVGVGGFLGLGERKVAVSFRSFAMTRDDSGKHRLVVDLTSATLKNAPEYKPADPAKRS